MKVKKFVALCVAAVFVCVLVVSPLPVNAAADTSPPKLISCTPTKAEFVSGEDVVFYIKAFDESGIDINGVSISLRNKDWEDRNEYFRVFLYNITDITTPEDADKGTYTYKCSWPVNDYFASGNYKVESIILLDNAGHGNDLCTAEIGMIAIHVTNTARTDFQAPEVVSVNIDKTSISVGQTVKFTIKASDTAGIDHAILSIVDPVNYDTYTTVALDQVGNDNTLWQGSFTAKDYTPEGYYIAYVVHICDKLGNEAPRPFDKKFYVKNADYHPGTPTVDSVSFSKSNVKPGDKVIISAKIDTHGMILSGVGVSLYGDSGGSDETYLEKDSTGAYVGEYTLPAKMQAGTYNLRFCIWDNVKLQALYFGKCNNYVFPKLRVESVFKGLENKSVLKGSGKFELLSGVSASNETEGDMTDKIEVQGAVDTNKTGLYLLRYKIKSNQTINYNGVETPIYYIESRWIGVTDIIPDNTAALSLTEKSIYIGANASDILIKKDGKKISFTNTCSAAGVYTLQEKDAVNSSVKAVVDKSGPAISFILTGKKSKFAVNIKAADDCGIKALKYLAGVQTAEKVLASGIDILKSLKFSASSNGKYTVWAQDKLGHVSLKVIDVKYISIKFFKFSKSSITLKKNKTYQTSFKFSPANASNKTLTYKSGNTKIATVDANGKIKALRKGKVKIYAYATDGSGKKAVITVTVK